MGVEAGADGRAALRQRIEPAERGLDPADAEMDLRGVAGEFLAERDGRRVLEMGAADLDEMRKAAALAFSALCEACAGPAAAGA